jgi:polysaccharide biosynthesis/export protein
MKYVPASMEQAAVMLSERLAGAAPGFGPPLFRCLVYCCSLALVGCTTLSRPHTVTPATQARSPSLHTSQTSGDQSPFTSIAPEASDLVRLAHLWDKRMHATPLADYPIGPGDVLEIAVPAMEELNGRVARVSGEGTITLPLIGVMLVAGLTETEVRGHIRHQLETYMHAPEFNLFVREYHSRQVAVIGAVAKPGLYNLASQADTIMDMVALAGGMIVEAAPRMLLIPAEPTDDGAAKALAPVLPVQLASAPPSSRMPKQTEPLVLDLQSLARGGDQIYLSLPARPGDVIIVPVRGEVLVQGWVAKPGPYKITSGLTVLGAVAAAGGPLYPADTNSVQIIRSDKHGNSHTYTVNLEQIKRGKRPDHPVQEGDVIEVTSSTAKLVPYGVYRFFNSLLHIGATVPLY